MAGRKSISQQYQSASNNFNIGGKSINVGIVEHVILNEDDENIPTIGSSEESSKLSDAYIGHSKIRKLNDLTPNKKNLNFYAPMLPDEGIPLVGETVQLIFVGGIDYYKRIPSTNINIGNAKINVEERLSESSEESQPNSDSYSEVSQTSTAQSDTAERDSELGEYFKPEVVHKLRLYEGDKIIQSRFGQSIRFSAYNNEEQSFSPTLVIRNRENDEGKNNLKLNELTEEDVNKDGSIIALTSQDYKMPFQPGLIDDGGSSNFETTPINFEIPEEYVGQDQILINSERIILSSKAAEMIFFSKGNYGFISDGKFTIDNGNAGADLDFGDTVNITTNRNDADFTIKTGNGEIRLNTDDSGNGGTGQKEPLARAQTLVDILDAMITAIKNQIYATPAGPTAKGPLNIPEFEAIAARLDQIKSIKNFTE
jgi:hypothetical protein